MKTRNILLTLGAVTMVALTLNATAGNALLSPRAADNQISRVAGVNNDANLVSVDHYTVTITPRAANDQVLKVAGTGDVNPATQCSRNMTGSPKAIQACAANIANMPCCIVASTK